MTTISKEAIQWMQDEAESKDAQIAELEEELELALEENQELRSHLTRLMSDRTLAV